MWLSMDSLTELHKYFEEHGDELSLEEFVTAMLKLCKDHAMGHNEQSMTALLVDLFAQVDVNGDGSLEWEEFSGFVVESGMGANATTSGGSGLNACSGMTRRTVAT